MAFIQTALLQVCSVAEQMSKNVCKTFCFRPAQPPIRTKPKNFFLVGPVESYCHCDGHLYDPQMRRYSQLAEKEKKLHEELYKVNLDVSINFF